MILVTGASGYLGKSFIQEYAKKYKILTFSLVDNQLKNINFENVSVVLHCAALVHQKKEYSYEKYYEINTRYPVELALKAKQSGVKQFIFISTVAVYGEDYSRLDNSLSCSPVSFYGRSKLEAEKELQKLSDSGFKVVIVRPPMVYGLNAPGNMSTLINLIRKVPILPFGNINNKRNFIYIGNLCYVLNQIIETNHEGVFLVSDDKSISTTELLRLISIGLKKKVFLIRIPLFETILSLVKPSFHKRLYESLEIDNSLTKQKLNLTNPYSVEEGIKLMIRGELDSQSN